MPVNAQRFSLREAAAIAAVPESTIRTAIEKRSITPPSSRVGKSIRYEFDLEELLLIKLLTEFPFALSKEDKQSLRHLIRTPAKSAGRWRTQGSDLLIKTGGLSIRVRYRLLRREIVRRFTVYRDGALRIFSDPEIHGGEPLIAGSRISFEHIVGLFRKGAKEVQIRKDYPRLSDLDLAFASLKATMGAPPGRPRKPLNHRKGPNTP